MIGDDKVYFIAEIGANHDGSLKRALKLIQLAADAGANAVKFQHYQADTLASREGFDELKDLAHYTDNPHTVFKKYELPLDWTPALAEACKDAGVDFMSTPYSLEAVDHLNPYVKVHKIGSGDITYHALIRKAASTGKPVLISTGASTITDILRMVSACFPGGVNGHDYWLMQCNTNYEVDHSKAEYANLSVIPKVPMAGYSDHTLDEVTVLGAVALGARIIEKHFTDNPRRKGSPDHPFAVGPDAWYKMVEAVRKLESAMGTGTKRLEKNEELTVVLQRRCLRAARDLPLGHPIRREDVVVLRPAPLGSLKPDAIGELIGKTTTRAMVLGEAF